MLKLHHLLFNIPILPLDSGRQVNDTMLVGQVALVEYRESFACEVDKADYVSVVHQCASDVIDLSSAIFSARIREEEGALVVNGAGGKIDQVSVWVLPDSVKLGLNEHARSLPDGPAYQLFSTVRDDLLWNNTEAFSHWLSMQRFVRNDKGCLVLGHTSAEVDNVS